MRQSHHQLTKGKELKITRAKKSEKSHRNLKSRSRIKPWKGRKISQGRSAPKQLIYRIL
jgi:hypothetical protein